MAVTKHLNQAVERMRAAAERIEVARIKEFTPAAQKEWLTALTDFALALADVEAFNNESSHEKLHELAARAGVKAFKSGVTSVG